MKIAAVAIAVVSSFALGYAVNDLSQGIIELPRHWWSTAPLVGLVVAGALGLTAILGNRTSRRL